MTIIIPTAESMAAEQAARDAERSELRMLRAWSVHALAHIRLLESRLAKVAAALNWRDDAKQ